jgi:hypothetical protein
MKTMTMSGNDDDDDVAVSDGCGDAPACEAAATWQPPCAYDDGGAAPQPRPPPPPPPLPLRRLLPPPPPLLSAEETPLTPGRAREAARARGGARGVHVAEVPGLRVLLDVVSEAEERDAMCALASDRGTPASNIHAATQWGWRFYTWNRVPPMSAADRLPPLPRWMRDVLDAAQASDPERRFLPSRQEWGSGVQHALLNEYQPGDGVVAHMDDPFFWTGWVGHTRAHCHHFEDDAHARARAIAAVR